MVSNQFKIILAEFARHTGCTWLQDQPGPTIQFVCNSQYIVHLANEPDSDNLIVYAIAGYAPVEDPEPIEESGSIDITDGAWDELENDNENEKTAAKFTMIVPNEIAPRLYFNEDSGAIVVWASACLSSLDSVLFANWIEYFLDKLTDTARYIEESNRQTGDDEPVQAQNFLQQLY